MSLSEVAQTVNTNFYVDDCLKSLSSVEKAIQIAHDLSDVYHKGGLHLSQWTSINQTVLQAITEQDHSNQVMVLDLDKDRLPTERASGIQWCLESDKVIFSINEKIKLHRCRGMLSVIASVCDPLGYLAPATLQAEVILQELCWKKKSWLGWDYKRDKATMDQMVRFRKCFCISSTKMHQLSKFGPPVKAELHHFADASNSGYGTVSYLWLGNHRKWNFHFIPLSHTSVQTMEQIFNQLKRS